ncbi:MAG TPA: phage holin family protein [Candidatus Dormibacteraeota bacterium]|nr:phage holin family protein [Candidatus Dormibacteraeota bacterium]
MATTESTPDLAAGIVDEAEKLVHLEIELAKQELKEMALTNAIAAGSFAVAGVLALLALLVGIPVLVVVAVEPHWLAALIWVVVYLLVAAGLALFGRSKLRIGIPERTVSSLKETRDWALRQMRSPGR